jgi:hypothetical protein
VVTHNLGADHSQGLALGRVDLSRHDGGTGLVLGEDEFAQTAARAGSEVTDILGDLEQRAGKGVQRARCLNNGVVGSENLELVGGSLELGAGQLADFDGNGLVETLEGVQTSTNGSATLCKVAQVRQRSIDALNVAVKLGNVARELLAKSKRGGVLEMGTSDLDDVLEVLNLLLESVTEAFQGREESVLEFHNSGDVHGSGERIVGGSGHVDVVIGVDRLLGAHLAAENFNGSVGNDLVRVHVGLGARAGLPDNKREVVQELALSNLSSSLLDSLADLGVYRASTRAS